MAGRILIVDHSPDFLADYGQRPRGSPHADNRRAPLARQRWAHLLPSAQRGTSGRRQQSGSGWPTWRIPA